MRHDTAQFTNARGETIFLQQWAPNQKPRAVIILSHGVCEHSGRYEHVTRRFVDAGYAVYALDHQGHGRSTGPRVKIAVFRYFVDDLEMYYTRVRTIHPHLPVFLYGHSMGAMISLMQTVRMQINFAGLITTGMPLRIAKVNALTRPLIKTLGRLVPFLKMIPPTLMKNISRDPAVLERFQNDPLAYHGWISIGMFNQLVHAAEESEQILPKLRLPILALHGGADRLARAQSAEIVRTRSGSSDTTVIVYDDLYHEVHNEPEKEQVLNDIEKWLDIRTSS